MVRTHYASTPKWWHHAVFECLSLYLMGCMLPRTSENSPSETVRKGSEEPEVYPYGAPERYFSTHFGLPTPPQSTLRVLFVPLFGQFLEREFYELRVATALHVFTYLLPRVCARLTPRHRGECTLSVDLGVLRGLSLGASGVLRPSGWTLPPPLSLLLGLPMPHVRHPQSSAAVAHIRSELRLQRGSEVVDPLVDVPQPGLGLRLQTLALGAALPPGAEPHLLQPCALLLQLRDHLPDLCSPAQLCPDSSGGLCAPLHIYPVPQDIDPGPGRASPQKPSSWS